MGNRALRQLLRGRSVHKAETGGRLRPTHPRAVATGPSPLRAGRHDHTLGRDNCNATACFTVDAVRTAMGVRIPNISLARFSALAPQQTPTPRWPGDRTHRYAPKARSTPMSRQNRKGSTYYMHIGIQNHRCPPSQPNRTGLTASSGVTGRKVPGPRSLGAPRPQHGKPRGSAFSLYEHTPAKPRPAKASVKLSGGGASILACT